MNIYSMQTNKVRAIFRVSIRVSVRVRVEASLDAAITLTASINVLTTTRKIVTRLQWERSGFSDAESTSHQQVTPGEGQS